MALGWIRALPAFWKTYVANRVIEIQTSLPDASWHHIPGRDNPANCALRCLTPMDLVNHPFWWHGPSWLRSEAGPRTPLWSDDITSEFPDRRTRNYVTATDKEDVEPALLTGYSSLHRLLHITACCRRLLRHQERRTPRAVHSKTLAQEILRAAELEEARLGWIRMGQLHITKES